MRPKPVVAALNGTTLGGVANWRWPATPALPSTTPGQDRPARGQAGPAAGRRWHQRLPRLIGIQKSFELITQGGLSPAKAKGLGIVNELAATREEHAAKGA
jgi:3-hydroxyacyl-CoA dehydrogenase/enoyl-CoA hydratase/3-hydroxybutyryl-CoA epimerase